jgi:hypothetical protein
MFAFYGGVLRSAVCIIGNQCTMPICNPHNNAMVKCIVEGSW